MSRALLLGLLLVGGCGETDSTGEAVPDTAGATPAVEAVAAPAERAAADTFAPEPPPPPPPAVETPDEPVRFERPKNVRGLYVNAWAAGARRSLERLLALADTTEINTFVIDLKDASGYVSYPTGVEEARAVGAAGEVRIVRPLALLERLRAAGIYPIARIVVVKDPILVAARPQWAVQDTAGGVWVDSKGLVWLNPYDERVWAYHMALAREAAEMGFPEIQWDYVRFPDASKADMARAVFPGDSLGERTAAIRAFLTLAREALAEYGVRMTADVFGVTATYRRDIGIGQLWESFIDRVDTALPMVYPSHYWPDAFGFETPNAHPYEVVREAMEDARERSAAVEGAGGVIPWLQDFTLGTPPYGAPEVRAQIQAVYDAGLEEWLLWNPGARYTEDALAPAGGFEVEPLIRVAGEIVPVSERGAALARAAALADSLQRADTVVADTSAVRRR